MMLIEYDPRIERIAKHYGLNHQLNKLNEEMAELMVAIHHKGRDDWEDDFIEEMADVVVVLSQIAILMYPFRRDALAKAIHLKLDRQMKRIAAESPSSNPKNHA